MRSYIIESSFPHIVVLMYWYHRFGHVQKLSTVVGLTPVQGEREPQVAMHQVDAQVSISPTARPGKQRLGLRCFALVGWPTVVSHPTNASARRAGDDSSLPGIYFPTAGLLASH